MKNTKKSYKPYAIWDYELEINELDRESENGWQLIHGGAFHREYEKDDSMAYRYQLDFNNKDEVAYYEMFKEQGWEYISSTFNGWNYFKKLYDPLAEESEYLIYTDKDSKKKMNLRFINLMLIIFIAGIISNFQHMFTFISAPKLANSGVLFVYGFYIFLYVKARIGVSKTIKGLVPKKRTKIEIYFLLFIISAFIMVAGSSESSWGNGKINILAEVNEEVEQNYIFDSSFLDFYYIEINLREGEVVKLRIENEDGKTIYENLSVEKNEKSERVFLPKGRYYCIITSTGPAKYEFKIK